MRRALPLVAALLAAGCPEPPGPRSTPSSTPSATPSAMASGAAATPAAPTASTAPVEPPSSPISSDERVVVFPGLAHWDGEAWQLDLHLWIFEPEESSWRRKAFADAVADALDLPEEGKEAARAKKRLAPFLVDNESGKVLTVELGRQRYTLAASGDDGHALGRVVVPASVVGAEGGIRAMRVLTKAGDDRRFEGRAHFVPPEGRMVVSDIDDTVKITEVTDKERLLRRTFIEPFAFFPHASGAYRARAKGVPLHFLSSSPYQLYEALQGAMANEDFPEATYDLKRWRPASADLDGLLGDPLQSKGAALERLTKRFPKRRLVLIGDSGERDPEVYGVFFRAHPDRVDHIAIRNVTDEKRESERMKKAFADLPADRWMLFTDARKLPE